MSFADNLRMIRKERGLSQEQLAELFNVSRQSVSKWEQGNGYPEVEKLISMANYLNISLDQLMGTNITTTIHHSTPSQSLLISSFDGKSIINCYKVLSSNRFKTKMDEPKYALFGIDGDSLWGEHTTILGWYDKEENIKKEMQEIMHALKIGDTSYELKYPIKTKMRRGKIKIDE